MLRDITNCISLYYYNRPESRMNAFHPRFLFADFNLSKKGKVNVKTCIFL